VIFAYDEAQNLADHAKGTVPAVCPATPNQMLASLSEHGMTYKNRKGKYSFAVPLLGRFIIRTYELRDAAGTV
jgi:hypothetical protein